MPVLIKRPRSIVVKPIVTVLIGLLACSMTLAFAPPKPLPKRPPTKLKKPPKPLPKPPPLQARKQPPRQSTIAHPSTKAKTAKPRNFSSYLPKTLRTRVNQWRRGRIKSQERAIATIEPHVRKLNTKLDSLSTERQTLSAGHASAVGKVLSLSLERKSVKKSYNVFSSKFRSTRLKRKQLQTQINVNRREANRLAQGMKTIDRNMAFIRKELKPADKRLHGHVNRKLYYERQLSLSEPGVKPSGSSQNFAVSERGSIRAQYDSVGQYDSVSVRGSIRPQYDSPESGGLGSNSIGASFGTGRPAMQQGNGSGGSSGQYGDIRDIEPLVSPAPGNSARANLAEIMRNNPASRTQMRPAITTPSNRSPYDSFDSGPL